MASFPWILLSAPIFAVSISIFFLVNPSSLIGFESSILAVDLGVSVFAINFSFIGYQLSPYRHFYRGISRNQIAASVILLVLGTSSYVALGIWPKSAPLGALAILPILLLGSVVLQTLAKHETSGDVVLARAMASATVAKFAGEFMDVFTRDRKTRPIGKPNEIPTHEWSWQLPPQTKQDDPFDLTVAIAALAVKNDDVTTFDKCITICLERIDQIVSHSWPSEHDSGAKDRVVDHAQKTIGRIWTAVREEDKSGAFTQRLQGWLVRYLIANLENVTDNIDKCFFAIDIVAKIAIDGLENARRNLALAPIVFARQIAQKGMDELVKNETAVTSDRTTIFRHQLPFFAQIIKNLGTHAIKVKDGDVLYRCLDALGWLGCSAVKSNNREIGCATLRALCQLGRESRSSQLECFWSKCALEPWQHADDRIDWILSWVSALSKDAQPGWIRTVEEALSRLHGVNVAIDKKTADDKAKFIHVLSDEPYKTNYGSWEGHRTIDYSDFSILKDLELY